MTDYELRKARLQNLTPEQQQARKSYKAAWARRARAAAKEKLSTLDNLQVAATASNTVQAAPAIQTPAPAVEDAPAPTVKQDKPSQPTRTSKPKSDRARRRLWSSSVVDFLTDALTDEACPLTGEWFEKHRMGSMWLGFYDKLNRIESTVEDKPDVLAELRLSIAIEAIRRLTGENAAGSAPSLPGTR
jgi:hypothetical protein